MVAPKVRRGRYYPTERVARCPMYHPCIVCRGCQRYDFASAHCRMCESGKHKSLKCPGLCHGAHSDETQSNMLHLAKILKGNLYHPDYNLTQGPLGNNVDTSFGELMRNIKKDSEKGDLARIIEEEEE